jgi:hypothetical protein
MAVLGKGEYCHQQTRNFEKCAEGVKYMAVDE